MHRPVDTEHRHPTGPQIDAQAVAPTPLCDCLPRSQTLCTGRPTVDAPAVDDTTTMCRQSVATNHTATYSHQCVQYLCACDLMSCM